MTAPHAVILGAGLGGLTAAVALHKRGWSVRVVERASSLEQVGTGIGLAANALRAFAVIGVDDAIRDLASPQEAGGLRRPDGSWLLHSDAGAFVDRFAEPISLLTRPQLIGLLTGRLPTGCLALGTEVTGVDGGSADRPASVHTTHGDEVADLVVGADGIRSRIRSQIIPDHHPGPRYAGYVAWRFLAPASSQPSDGAETWGRGARFGAASLAHGRWSC